MSDLKSEELVGTFYEKELQKTNQKEFRIEKVIKRKGDKLHFKYTGYNNPLSSWIDKKRHGINEWIPFKTKTLEANVKVELHFSNYATKADFKNATGTDTSDFAKNTDLANLKSDVDNIDIDKLKKCTK